MIIKLSSYMKKPAVGRASEEKKIGFELNIASFFSNLY